jgi:O-antigen/teichoic acid export membrane protein
MTSLKKNLAFTFLGKIWTTLMSIAFLPYIIRLIGIESYGLVGIYTSLLALFSVLDLGLGNTMNREMAKLSSQDTPAESYRDLTRTLEWVYWIMAVIIGAVVWLGASFFSAQWIHCQTLSQDVIKQVICLIGIALAFLWPSSLYSGGLMGLQRQVLLNSITVACATLRGLGMIFVLTFISSTIECFFFWQIIVNGLQTALFALFFWKGLPKSIKRPRFNIEVLKKIKRFATGIACITLLATILAQLDKVILSKFLTLELFGYYCLATMVANSLFYVTVPIYSVFFPHFTQLVYSKDEEQLSRMYHLACQMTSILVLPTALLGIFFTSELLFVWSQSRITADQTQQLVKLLMTGTLLNALATIPFALQLAHGWVRLSFYLNLFGVVFMVPSLWWVSSCFGAKGAASMWAVLNAAFLLITLQAMHRKILKKEKWQWCVRDILLPCLASSSFLLIGRWLFPKQNGTCFTIVYLSVVYVLSLLAAFAISPAVRSWMMDGILKKRTLWSKHDIPS